MKQIAKALIESQKEMSNAKKGATNPFFKSKYADLNSVREACISQLNEHGIVVLQPMVHFEGKNFVKTILLHESGEQIESMTEILFKSVNDAQAQGSGITYARRYGLQSLVCIGAEDEDGNLASKTPPTPPPSISLDEMKATISASKTMDELKNNWLKCSKLCTGESLKEIETLKNEIKEKLTKK